MLAAHRLGVAAGQRHRRVEPAAAGRVAGQPAEPAAGREPLPAAALAARARRAVRVDDHVAGLAGEPVGAVQQPPAGDDPGADARAEGDHERVVDPDRGAGRVLGHGVAVGVVVDDGRRPRRASVSSAAMGTSCMRRRCGPMCRVPSRSTRPGHAHADRRRASGASVRASSSSTSTSPSPPSGVGDAVLGEDGGG